MTNLLLKAAITFSGPLVALACYQLSGPWWVYLMAVSVFLLGLLSFSVDSEPDRSGYGKRADDSRDSFGGDAGSGGGEC